MNKTNEDKTLSIIFGLLFIAETFLLLWRCKYGFGYNDEAFYLTIPLRLFDGDCVISNEWHMSCLSGFVLLPVICLYKLFFNGTESIIINFRYIYVFFWVLTALFVYIRLKKYSKIGSMLASLSFLLVVVNRIYALSYNTISIICLFICSLLILDNRKKSKTIYIISGILFALAVLCRPPLIVIYILYSIYYLVFKKKRKEWLWFTIGASIVAVILAIFILSRTSIAKIIKSIPYMLDDPEHTAINWLKLPLDYLSSMICVNEVFKYCLIIYGVVFVVCVVDKKRYVHKNLYTIVSMTLLFVAAFSAFFINNENILLYYPIALLGLPCLLYNNKSANRIFVICWLPSIIYSLVAMISSNTHAYAITCGAVIAAVCSIVMLYMVLDNRKIKLVFVLLTCFLIAIQMNTVYYNVRNDGIIIDQKYYIEDGPDKGLYVNERKYNEYYDYYNDINNLEYLNNNITYISEQTWLILLKNGTNRNYAYSCWQSGNPERLIPYYEINEIEPDNIYAESVYYDLVKQLADKYSLVLEITETGRIFCHR